MQTPRWLVASVVGVVATTAALSIGWVGICTWVVGPKLFEAAQQGKLAQEPAVCSDADNRALQTLTALLATLLALMSNPPSNRPPGDSR
jgi:hypothetical protein